MTETHGGSGVRAPGEVEFEAVWLGRRAFAEALELQVRRREEILAGTAGPALFLVEHPPTLTVGRRGRREDILWSDAQLQAFGVAVAETPRGGQVTLHAPGQLVAYPVFHVGPRLRSYLEALGSTTVRLLEELGVEHAQYQPEHPGVWREGAKLASIGIHVSRGVCVQGVSVNLDVDPTLFGALVSCGLQGVSVVSATTVGGRAISVADAAQRWAVLFAEHQGATLRWST